MDARNQIVTELYDCYMANGFITEDEALLLLELHNIPFHLIDSIIEQILAMGTIITADEDVAEWFNDKSKSDYELFFREVIALSPELEPFIEYIRNITPPQRREWHKLIPQAQDGNEYARNRLIEMYMKVVVKQALYYSKKYRLPIDDTIQDGMVGLITSIEKYNPADYLRYAEYIPWWIAQSIRRNSSVYCNPVYFPALIREDLFTIMSDVEEHICEHCPNHEQNICPNLVGLISKKNDWSTEKAEKYIKYLNCCKSRDEMIENDVDISDEKQFSDEMEEMFMVFNYRQILLKFLDEIKPRERYVLLLRFGFTKEGALSLAKIGKIFGFTKEGIRQINVKTIRKLRQRL